MTYFSNSTRKPSELSPTERENLAMMAAVWEVEYEETQSQFAWRERLRCLALLGFKLSRDTIPE